MLTVSCGFSAITMASLDSNDGEFLTASPTLFQLALVLFAYIALSNLRFLLYNTASRWRGPILLLGHGGRERPPLPPGPKKSEIDIAKLRHNPWLTFREWGKTYGPITSYTLLPSPLTLKLLSPYYQHHTTIVLNTSKSITDLLSARSSIYSDRPVNWMTNELARRKWNVFNIRSTEGRFKMYRRVLGQGMREGCSNVNGSTVEQGKSSKGGNGGEWGAIQEEECRMLIKALVKRPDDFLAEVRRSAVAVILKLAYGFQIGGNDDHFVRLIEETFALSSSLLVPGKYLVEFFPILRFVSDRFPGAGFKRHAKEVGQRLDRMSRAPFQWTKNQIASGTYLPSFTSKLLTSPTPYLSPSPSAGLSLDSDSEKEDIITWCSSALYVGGGDTVVSALSTFFLVMQLYPAVQARAQGEVDRVLAEAGRFVRLGDWNEMPYVVAVMKEVLRWGPPAPLGIPHSVTKDDTYGGYLIPKGSKVVPNIWAVMHDEEMYPDPEKFSPERHLGENPQPDPTQFVFGFGKRVCPGARFAENGLFLNIANILAVFDISKARTFDGKVKSGVEIEPCVRWTTSVTSHLEPFTCRITPRASASHLVETVLEMEDPVADGLHDQPL
ncbi:cytochrome P450 [Coprinopsis marcescibilis]|uniref:Cytochrome P450 n=1 Tax=Coprinopsis marcescibilis TaxID=230819 RepID=A0A5C3KE69_COPMA|nr:cytochrome P450 [Coprinopsis marcescibilis]